MFNDGGHILIEYDPYLYQFIRIVLKMLKNKMDEKTIKQMTNISTQDLEKIKKENNNIITT